MKHLWTVVRFPDGSWSYGGSPNASDYECCEVWQIEDTNPYAAIRKAQSRRSYWLKRERKSEGGGS